jgi:hypothetical protein
MRRISWAMLIATIALIVAGVLSFATSMMLLFIPGLVLFISWTMPSYIAWLSWRNSPVWRAEHVIIFGPGGIDVSTGMTSGHTASPAVMRTAENAEFFLFFSSDQAARFVPKRGLSPFEVETLREMFATRAGKADASGIAADGAHVTDLDRIRALTRVGLGAKADLLDA